MRKYSGVLAGLVPMLVAGVVLADGSWTSSMSNVNVGFDSRTWTDRNTDNVGTTIRFDD